jgi:NADPH:quinone reductase-like Zn-dependent oxidoreductase
MVSNAPRTIPPTQKAWIVKQRGHPSISLELKSDWPVPTRLATGDVLVKVQAGALNPLYVATSTPSRVGFTDFQLVQRVQGYGSNA